MQPAGHGISAAKSETFILGEKISNGLQPNSYGLQPSSDGHPSSFLLLVMPLLLVAMHLPLVQKSGGPSGPKHRRPEVSPLAFAAMQVARRLVHGDQGWKRRLDHLALDGNREKT